MRGAGNLLGPEQSGFAQAVGFDTYLRLLEDTVAALRRGADRPVARPQVPDVSISGATYLPDSFIPDEGQKLEVYRRLSRVADLDEVERLTLELRDRFGVLPTEVERLIAGAIGESGALIQISSSMVARPEQAVTLELVGQAQDRAIVLGEALTVRTSVIRDANGEPVMLAGTVAEVANDRFVLEPESGGGTTVTVLVDELTEWRSGKYVSAKKNITSLRSAYDSIIA